MFDDAANAILVFIGTAIFAAIGVAVGAVLSYPVITFGAGAIMIVAAAAAAIAVITSLAGR